MRRRLVVFLIVLGMTVVACDRPPAEVPTTVPAKTATSVPAPTPSHTAAPTSEPVATAVPMPTDAPVEVESLPLGETGHYVNVAFGFEVEHPLHWYTGFGNRPLVASFSDLDPGMHNRESMRAQGCLVEITVSANVYGLTPQQVVSQLARGFPNSQEDTLGGLPATRIDTVSATAGLESTFFLMEHEERLFTLVHEHAQGENTRCADAWAKMLSTWRWLDPQMSTYRNRDYGYAVAYPRGWHTFNPVAEGISISQVDPQGSTEEGLSVVGMVVRTTVNANSRHLELKEWLVSRDWDMDLADDIPVNGLLGVRMFRDGITSGTRELSAFFQGPLGKIYQVACTFPSDRADAYEPIADAVIFSFSF